MIEMRCEKGHDYEVLLTIEHGQELEFCPVCNAPSKQMFSVTADRVMTQDDDEMTRKAWIVHRNDVEKQMAKYGDAVNVVLKGPKEYWPRPCLEKRIY